MHFVTYRHGYDSLWQAVCLQLVASDRIKEIIERVNVSKFSRTWTLLPSWAQNKEILPSPGALLEEKNIHPTISI